MPSSPKHRHGKDAELYPRLKPEEKYKIIELYYSLNSTWSVINSPQFCHLPVVKKIKQMWNSTKPRKIIQTKPRVKRKNITTTASPHAANDSEQFETTTVFLETTTRMKLPGRQNPFVLVEGTLTKTRRKLVRGLMTQTTFLYVRNFRKQPFNYDDKFYRFDLLPLRRAFVSLQFYITGRDVHKFLDDRPVIMSGFWMRQAVEFIKRKYQDNLPPVGSDCYKWPVDIPKPDLVFFLHTPRPHNLTEETLKRLDRTVEIYNRMEPPVTVLDQSYNELTTKQLSKLRKLMLEKIALKYPYANEYVKLKPSLGKKRKYKLPKVKKKKDNGTTLETTTQIDDRK